MKRILLLTFILCAGLSTRSLAALGDSEGDIEALFGTPTDIGFPDKRGVSTNLYKKGDYVILVQFLNHASLAESYTRTDQHEFSQREIDAFLEGSSNDRSWSKDPDKLEWERSDHKARAWCETLRGRPTLLIHAK